MTDRNDVILCGRIAKMNQHAARNGNKFMVLIVSVDTKDNPAFFNVMVFNDFLLKYMEDVAKVGKFVYVSAMLTAQQKGKNFTQLAIVAKDIIVCATTNDLDNPNTDNAISEMMDEFYNSEDAIEV